ncbi:Vacuolar protein sorting-associated protein 41 -like protein [Ceratocystis fimbriata CBS 114723]|uniref:Vacuolar protein sorting-associated protein 41-like protein n=1 Tax=Ceratocystis fimbriata CBS 114723 TaxID=1035309 RepID=A0A2C5WXP3_9PEZI|nr:Vacuolar protein sorting-associated protein 41 -like protein [Ceratocystis fimbriata CBS 114723]
MAGSDSSKGSPPRSSTSRLAIEAESEGPSASESQASTGAEVAEVQSPSVDEESISPIQQTAPCLAKSNESTASTTTNPIMSQDIPFAPLSDAPGPSVTAHNEGSQHSTGSPPAPHTVTDVETTDDDQSQDGGPDDDDNDNDNEDDEDEDDNSDEQSTEEESEDEDESEDSDEEEEPQLKTARLTTNLGPIYRNGDATSAFLVGGDKMIVGTHNGNIHVLQLPIFQNVRVYHAHSASVTAISISPFPPPIFSQPNAESGSLASAVPSTLIEPLRRANSIASTHTTSTLPRSANARSPAPVPNIPSNNIYIATSSTDGNVCIQSLIDPKDVQLRNFARPVQAVALSPDYRNDRTYLSGGLAGNLIVTVGGSPGRSTSTTIGTAAATASGWLGSIGLGSGSGKDTILHSGEGPISTIKWSLSGKYVAWLNEFGIKIMRSRLHLDAADAPEDAWKRIGHIDRPQTEEWDTMASVWKGRAEWIDEKSIETETATLNSLNNTDISSSSKSTSMLKSKTIERLVVGWGGTIWIIHVHPGAIGVGKHVGERIPGRAEIANVLRMDCIISGFSFFSTNLLLVLAFCQPENDDEDEHRDGHDNTDGQNTPKTRLRSGSEPSGGIKRRQNNKPPELRLIDLDSQFEVDKVGLILSRYERLSCNDYCLGVLPAMEEPVGGAAKGALETIAGLGTDMWNAATNPMALFSSAASVTTRDSNDDTMSRISSTTSGILASTGPPTSNGPGSLNPNMAKPGMKIFIHSPYDCILAMKRDLGDRLEWLLGQKEYQQAWELLDSHPEILDTPFSSSLASASDESHMPDDNSSVTATSSAKSPYSPTEKEKRRVGELWIRSIVEAGRWREAGEVCSRVLTTGDRWEKWVWTFAGAHKFDEIVHHIPSSPMSPPIPPACYEVILGHYIKTDKPRMRDLLLQWPTELFDISAITTTLENQLKFRDVREDSVEAGEVGRDWRIVVACLARLHEANVRTREALKHHIRLKDADAAFRLIRQGHLAEVVADDIPSFIGLRVEPDFMGEKDLEEATSEAITLLVDEARHGLVKPSVVVKQLMAKDLRLYTFFYLRGLWTGAGVCDADEGGNAIATTNGTADRLVMESKSLVDEFADLAVSLFATHDRNLLLAFLRTSTSYAFEAAVKECEKRSYDDELVFLYSKTGEMKKALFLIIDRLHDVSKAISFAKEQDDPDLWEDLLNYSMDKPRFIRGLLEQVGTALDPIRLVKRIPEGLEIDGLREGLGHMLREHEIMCSISEGVARVLRSEVSAAQKDLRIGQRRGVKFDVASDYSFMSEKANGGAAAQPLAAKKRDIFGQEIEDDDLNTDHLHPAIEAQPRHCAKCHRAFSEFEEETLVGFVCGHVFHTSHLLEMTQPRRRVDQDLITSMGDNTGGGYLIGSKVTHARLLRGRVRGGCPICH